jgi:hypothetical protein
MSRIDAIQQYNAAYRHGVKFYNTCIAQGKSPYPPVLDDIANETQISGQQVIGIVEIPLNLVVGTLAAGRKSAFAGNFKPILPDNSEGAAFGAAVLGFIASGELSGIGATGDLVKPRRIIRPNPEEVRVYGELYKIFDSLYWKLQPELASIAAFQQNRA